MKTIVLFFCLSAALLCGCAHNYVITMDNGRRITTASKPHLERGYYVYKDALGRKHAEPAGRVREIAPASMVDTGKPSFNEQPQR